LVELVIAIYAECVWRVSFWLFF